MNRGQFEELVSDQVSDSYSDLCHFNNCFDIQTLKRSVIIIEQSNKATKWLH